MSRVLASPAGWHMILGGIPLLALAAVQEGAEAPARLAQLTGELG